MKFISSTKRPDWTWGQRSPLINRHRGLLPRNKATGACIWHSPLTSAKMEPYFLTSTQDVHSNFAFYFSTVQMPAEYLTTGYTGFVLRLFKTSVPRVSIRSHILWGKCCVAGKPERGNKMYITYSISKWNFKFKAEHIGVQNSGWGPTQITRGNRWYREASFGPAL